MQGSHRKYGSHPRGSGWRHGHVRQQTPVSVAQQYLVVDLRHKHCETPVCNHLVGFPIADRLFYVNRVLLVLASTPLLLLLPRYDTYDEVMKVLPKLPRPVLISFLRPVGMGQFVVGQFVDGNPAAAVRRSSTPSEVTREGIDAVVLGGFDRKHKSTSCCVPHACRWAFPH